MFCLYRCNVCNGTGSIAKSLDNCRFFFFYSRIVFTSSKKSISSFHTYQKTDEMSDKAGLYDICKHTKLPRKIQH